MATPINGSISMADAAAEFGTGADPSHSIDEFYGAGPGITTTGPIDFDSLRGRSSNTAEFDLRRTDTPTGLNYNPNQSTLSTEQALDGYRTAGNSHGEYVYELHTTDTFSGDVLFETSVQVTNSCGDASFAIAPDMSKATWFWGPKTNRIALTFNCQRPYLYGTTTSTDVGVNITSWGTGVYYTMHLHHQPSVGVTRGWVTQGLNDWENETANRIGSIVQVANTFSSDVGCGVASDFDGAVTSASSTNFQRIRINVGY